MASEVIDFTEVIDFSRHKNFFTLCINFLSVLSILDGLENLLKEQVSSIRPLKRSAVDVVSLA